MPKYRCPCGHIINLSLIPRPDVYLFIGEVRLDSLWDRLDAALREDLEALQRGESPPILGEAVAETFSKFLRCPQCGRLIFFWGDDGREQVYVPETDRDPADDAGA